MNERKRIFLLITIMVTSCIIVTGATIAILYKTAIKEERARLMETAQSQARLIEAVARFDAIYSKSYPGGSRPATLSQIIDAHENYMGFGETGEFTLSEKVGDNIVFLLRHRHYDLDNPKPVPFKSNLAEPMRRALSGSSGTVVGIDYRGEMVLAAYEPVSELNLGIVAKIDMSEVRTPFVKAGLVGMFFTVLVVLIGTSFFIRITNPMIRQLENRTLELEKMNDEMKIEINERMRIEKALRESGKELAIRNKITDNFVTFSDDSLYSEVLNVVMAAMGSDKGFFGYIDETGSLVCPSMTRDIWDQCMVPDKTIVFTRDAWDGMWGRTLYEKKTLCSNMPLSVPEGHIPLIRALSVPIIFQDELAGQIVVANKETDYDEKDINLLETIANSIAPVLKARFQRDNQERKRKKAEEKLRKAHDELEQQVEKRTVELVKTNEQLEEEIEERKRADKAVRESEERYALAVAGSTDGIWDWDITSDTVFYSNRFSEILRYSPEEFPGTVDTFRNLLHPEDADVTWAAVERHLQKRVPYNIECRLRTKSGEFRWFLARGQAIWDSKGNATRMSGSLQDITKRVEAVQNLKDALSEIKKLKENLEAERAYLQEEIKLEHNFENIIGQSNDLNYVLYKVEQIATTDTSVLVLGETGTGKELVARAIHGSSPRKDRPLLKVNCATLPSNLIESELFGHERGAFTGAYARQLGRFEVVNGATIFLDEIGELPLELQPKLLRVIQDGEFERLGSSQTIKVDVRIIAATNRKLEEEVRNGRFREDLWYRLNIFPISVPPLRERMEDLPLLVEFFVDKISRKLGKSIKNIPASVMKTLQNYHWPGNIRELENMIERAVINSSGPKLRLMDELKKRHKELTTTQKTMKEVEHDHIVRVLEQTNWKVSGKNGASEILGLDRSTLRARMRKLGIKRP